MQATCENCGRTSRWRPRYEETYTCTRCGSWSYLGAIDESPDQLYDETYFNGGEYAGYSEGEAAFSRNFAHLADLVEKHGRRFSGARMVEVGCATGVFLEEARRRGVAEAVGIETSEYCRKIATGRGLDVVAPGPEALARVEQLRPDLLVAWDVWEHLRHPSQQIDELLERCAPDVTVALTTVDAGSLVASVRGTRWRQYHPPTHLHYPTRKALTTFLTDRSFSVAHLGSVGYFRPLLAYLQALGLHRARWLAPWHEVPVYLNLWDIQLVIASRKPGETQ